MAETFRLQQVLDHKRRQEEEKTLQLTTLSAEQRRTQEDLRALREKEEAQLHALQEIARVGSIDPLRLDAAVAYLDAIEGSIVLQTERASSIDQRVEESRDELISILKEKQLLQKLEQQHAADLRDRETRRENGRLDDVGAQRYVRGGEAS